MQGDNSFKNTILIDSDAFVGLFYEKDVHHDRVSKLFYELRSFRRPIATTSFVIAETATVLSNRQDQLTARKFLAWAKKLPIIHITEELQNEALTLFEMQTKKRTSVVDCANVVVMKHLGMKNILSFDRFYKKFDLQIA